MYVPTNLRETLNFCLICDQLFIWFGSLGPGWFCQITNQAQLSGFGTRVSLSDFCLWWSSWSPLHYVQKCNAGHQNEKISRVRKHNRQWIIQGHCFEFESWFGCWCVCSIFFDAASLTALALWVLFAWLEEECNTSITKPQRSRAGIPSMPKRASRETMADSVELCETEVCFLHIQLVGTNVWLPKDTQDSTNSRFLSLQDLRQSQSLETVPVCIVVLCFPHENIVNRTPSHRVFSRTFAHISSLFTCTAWLQGVARRVFTKERSSTCHHVSDRSLSLLSLTSSSLSIVSTTSLVSSPPLSCSSSMWSEPPSVRTPAHTQNEECCPLAIHNPLKNIA